MTENTGDRLLRPKSNQAKEYLRRAAAGAVTNTALARSCIVLAAGLIGLAAWNTMLSKQIMSQKPLIVRVNDIGRAEAINYQWKDYSPQDNDMKYFLNQFVTGFYARNHATVQDVYPASLHFLRKDLFESINANDRNTKWMAKFLNSTDPDVSVTVNNISLDRELAPRYKGEVDAVEVETSAGGVEQKRTVFVVTVWFRVKPLAGDIEKDSVYKDMIKYNPLGFTIDSFRYDPAFETTASK